MKYFFRIILSSAGALIVVLGILLIGANLYVQSKGTQARIQQELSQRIGAPLRIQRISVTPWWGLKLSGITIPQSNPEISGDFLEAKAFRLRIRFTSLFSQELVIKAVSLVDPTVVWTQNADGKWRIPSKSERAPVVRKTAPEETAAPSPQTPETPAPASAAAASEIRQEKRAKTTANVPEIRRVDLAGGNFRFLDSRGNIVAKFEGVEFHSTLRRTLALRGATRIAKTSLRDRFFLEQLQSPLQYDPSILDLAKISARAGGGEVLGNFTMRPQETGSPFTVHVNFHDVQADRLVADAGGPLGVVQGRLEGRLDADGKTADPNALSGNGEIFLRDGQVKQYSLLVALSEVLQIDELRQLHFDEAHAKYHLTHGFVKIDDLTLNSARIRLSGNGAITFSGKLQLEAQLAVDEKLYAQLFRPIRQNFQPPDDSGYAALNFSVGGTIDKPKTDLMDKLVGRDLKDFGSALKNLLRGEKSERPKKKKSSAKEEPEASASPDETSPSPTP